MHRTILVLVSALLIGSLSFAPRVALADETASQSSNAEQILKEHRFRVAEGNHGDKCKEECKANHDKCSDHGKHSTPACDDEHKKCMAACK